jgi:Arc/MetJ-type ribon-helix-helix transcriptional regulator
MTTVTISLPDHIAQNLDKETLIKGFATRSEFIRALLRSYFSSELKFKPFIPLPIAEIENKLVATGKYNEKFIKSLSRGIAKSSLYENKTSKKRSG